MADRISDHERDRDRKPANDNSPEGRAVAPAPAGGAVTSIAALAAALDAVDLASAASHSGKPMGQFKREGNGTWLYGQRRTEMEDGSRWALNPHSVLRGYISFNDAGKKVGERVVDVYHPMPDPTQLPDTGFKWQEQWGIDMKCLDGADTGIEVAFRSTTEGGKKAVSGLMNTVHGRMKGGQHNGEIVPIVLLEKSSYLHSQYGRIWEPVFTIVGWMLVDGPSPQPAAPAPKPAASTSTAAEQPRRRRVG
jgi:hypothetical protein